MCVCGCGPVKIGLCGGIGSSGRHCLLLIALYGSEMCCLYWYLLLLHDGGPEMSVCLMYCLAGAGGVGERGVLWVGWGCACDGNDLCVNFW